MFVRGLEARAHGVNGDVRCPQFLPRRGLANPLVEASIAYGQAGFDAQGCGIATCLPGISAQAFEGFAHLVVGIALWKPAVAKSCYAPQQVVGCAAQPDWDSSARGEWI